MYLIALDMRLYSVANAMEIDRIAFLIASLPRPLSVLNCKKKTGSTRNHLVLPVFYMQKPRSWSRGAEGERCLGGSRLGAILAPSGQALVVRHTAGDGP